MSIHKPSTLALAIAASLPVLAQAAPGADSAYMTDAQNTSVHDSTSQGVDQVNMGEHVAIGEVQVSDGGRELKAAAGEEAASDLRRVLESFERDAVKVLDVGLRRPTLDDVFLSLTGHESTEADQ